MHKDLKPEANLYGAFTAPECLRSKCAYNFIILDIEHGLSTGELSNFIQEPSAATT